MRASGKTQCLAVLAAVVAVGGGTGWAADPTPTSTPTQTPTETGTVTPTSTPLGAAAILGQEVGSDYVAKHFSFLFGAVVLNPFKLNTPKPTAKPTATAASGAMPAGAPTPDPCGSTVLQLAGDGTTADPFLELGFRYRWAWLDRLDPVTAARRQARNQLSLEQLASLASAENRLAEARRELTDAQSQAATVTTAAERAAPGEASDEQNKKTIATMVAAAQDRVVAATTRVADAEVEVRTQDVLVNRKATQEADRQWNEEAARGAYWFRGGSMWAGPDASRQSWLYRTAMFFVPDDWTARMGYVFGADSDSGASAIVGGSNFYGDLAMGWNLVRFPLFTTPPHTTPIWSSINLEGDVTLTTDNDVVDVHERYLIGPSFVFGVPLIWKSESTSERTTAAPKAPDPIIELVVRTGAVNVDSLVFCDDDSDRVVTKNGFAQFEGRWGFGFDMEFNVPITRDLGYIVARGSLNAGFDPNPWVLQIGYTIPLSSVVKAFAPGATTGGGGS